MTSAPAYPRRAHLYWVRVPDEPRGKRRPALVVSSDSRNRLANDVIVVPVSSVLREAPTHVRLRADEGGLARPSVAKCEQITTLDKSFLLRGPFAGLIRPSLMQEVEKAIQRSIGIPVPYHVAG